MRILEISRSGFFKALQPDDTAWIRWGTLLTAQEPYEPEQLSLSRLVHILQVMRGRTYDLLVLPAVHPDHEYDQSHFKLAAKHALRAAAGVPGVPKLLDRLVGATPYIIIDLWDDPSVCETTMRLFPRHLCYFKRELDFGRILPSSLEKISTALAIPPG